jgi:hypothetical protein
MHRGTLGLAEPRMQVQAPAMATPWLLSSLTPFVLDASLLSGLARAPYAGSNPSRGKPLLCLCFYIFLLDVFLLYGLHPSLSDTLDV